MSELIVLDRTPRWIFQPKFLRHTEAWQRNYDLPENARGYEAFMGIKARQTTPRFEYPDYSEPGHFLIELFYLPSPGPIKEYDEEKRLVDVGTLRKVNGQLVYVGTRVHYDHNPASEISKVVTEYTDKGDLKKELVFDKKDQLRRERNWDKNHVLTSERNYLNGQLAEHRFLSPQGEVYVLDEFGKKSKEAKALVHDNVLAKKTKQKIRRSVFEKICNLRRNGNFKRASLIRSEFDKNSGSKRQRPFLSRLLKPREHSID